MLAQWIIPSFLLLFPSVPLSSPCCWMTHSPTVVTSSSASSSSCHKGVAFSISLLLGIWQNFTESAFFSVTFSLDENWAYFLFFCSLSWDILVEWFWHFLRKKGFLVFWPRVRLLLMPWRFNVCISIRVVGRETTISHKSSLLLLTGFQSEGLPMDCLSYFHVCIFWPK